MASKKPKAEKAKKAPRVPKVSVTPKGKKKVRKSDLKKDGTPDRRKNKSPNPRQLKAIKLMSENVRSLGDALRGAGYSESVARKPAQVTGTQSWQELIDSMIPEDLVAKRFNELLSAGRVQTMTFPDSFVLKEKAKQKLVEQPQGGAIFNSSDPANYDEVIDDDVIRFVIEEIPGCRVIAVQQSGTAKVAYYNAPDNQSRKSALDMALKVRRAYSPKKEQARKGRFSHLTNEELAAQIAKVKKHLTKR